METGVWIALGLSTASLIISCFAMWIAYLNGDTRDWHDRSIGR
jgi:hypothetical protein